MSNLTEVQSRLPQTGCAALLMPSSDEYLSEYARPRDRRLPWLTGFTGSIGSVIVGRDKAAIFVDGRYTEQAARQVDTDLVSVCGFGSVAQVAWMRSNLAPGEKLAVDSRLHSEEELSRLLDLLREARIEIELAPRNLVDDIWREGRPEDSRSTVFDYDIRYAGLSRQEKIAGARARLAERGQELLVVGDPEDVAWLLNIRSNDSRDTLAKRNFVDPVSQFRVPVPLSRALVPLEGAARWFVDRSRLEHSLIEVLDGTVEIMDPAAFDAELARLASGRIVAANARRTNHHLAGIIRSAGKLVHDPSVVAARGIKHENEIAAARAGHKADGAAVVRFLAWLLDAVKVGPVTELDAAERVTQLRAQNPLYLGPSMSNLSASGPNAALPHYVPTPATNRLLNDHPVYWLDSGGQYLGCSTDNTVCFAVGMPEPKHVTAHTLAVKGWLALGRARFPEGTQSTQLDSFARQHLWQHGMDFGHGTGHGVGNFLNIHEVPHIRKEIDHPAVAPIRAGMIVSNEPGYYAQGDFGVRIESHILAVPSRFDGFLEFETLSMLPIDPALIDATLLDDAEARWLADYHEALVEGYRDTLDGEAMAWLESIADAFHAIANARPK
ncbi:aminopeptidase P family protein [Sphingobium chungbukense]|uniref:aminopeptidase P family protein n=1 Tax=Sphingobium chungbukense TaxID=56193 RepID=UPI00069B0FB1|nr:aminopeptidase P family protein [Sphingobium chungbukense]